MNSHAIDMTEARPDRRDNAGNAIVVTPILKKSVENNSRREDISATLQCESIFDCQPDDERTLLHSEYGNKIFNKDYISGYERSGESPDAYENNDNENRITLLARKYATKSMSAEDSARLDILTQRFRNAMPALNEKDLEIMGYFNEKIENGIELSNRIKEKYKLK